MEKWRRTWLALVGGLAMAVVLAAPASATTGGDPPGNNGTIKIDGKPFDDAPDNEPHPGCVFQVDFYGFDAGDLNADLTFEAVAPTAGGVLLTDTVPIGEDSHAGGGSEAGLDASKTYDLSSELAGIAPQRNQGWHVRLTVHADGSQGSDVKHKVFWVDDCTTATAPTAPQSSDTAGASSSALPFESDTAPAGADTLPASVLGTEVTAQAPATPAIESAALASPVPTSSSPADTAAPAQVLGESVTRAPSSATGASSLARTGIGLGLAVVAFALLGLGVVLQRAGRLRLPRLGS